MTGEVEDPGVVLDVRLLADFRRDMGDLGKIGGERFHIFLREADGDPGFLPARLHGSAARNHDHQLGAEIGEDIGAGLAKAIAISQQHDDRGDAPRHAQHGERSAAPVVPHGAVGFVEQITEHIVLLLVLTPAGALPPAAASRPCARDRDPATTPARVRLPIASMADIGTSLGGSNPPGPCTVPSIAIKPAASPMPISPLPRVRSNPSRKK